VSTIDQREWRVARLVEARCVGAIGCGSSTRLVRERERERDNGKVVLMGGEGRRQSIRIEPATEGNVGGRHTSLGAAYKQGGEIGRFWVRWGMAEVVLLL
jgi:hypothetical protein